jgi:hypothetical protein
MKKLALFVFVGLFAIGLGTTVNAATLTFDTDFWTDGTNPVNNYDRSGPGDLGQTIILQPSERLWVDIYFSTDAKITAASYDLQFDPSNLEALEGNGAGSPWALPTFEFDTPGSVKYQDVVFPPGNSVTGDNIFFGSVLLHCTGISVDPLKLENYLGFVTTDPTGSIDITPVTLGTLNQVPIPGALWLLGSGLIGLLGLIRKKRV